MCLDLQKPSQMAQELKSNLKPNIKTYSSAPVAKKTKNVWHTSILFTATVNLPNSAFCISKTTKPISTKFIYFPAGWASWSHLLTTQTPMDARQAREWGVSKSRPLNLRRLYRMHHQCYGSENFSQYFHAITSGQFWKILNRSNIGEFVINSTSGCNCNNYKLNNNNYTLNNNLEWKQCF